MTNIIDNIEGWIGRLNHVDIEQTPFSELLFAAANTSPTDGDFVSARVMFIGEGGLNVAPPVPMSYSQQRREGAGWDGTVRLPIVPGLTGEQVQDLLRKELTRLSRQYDQAQQGDEQA